MGVIKFSNPVKYPIKKLNLGLLVVLHKAKIFLITLYNSVLTSKETNHSLYIKK